MNNRVKIKKLLAINVPIKNCNLSCKYCYISALNKVELGPAKFQYSPEHVGICLRKERLGGECIINLTGGGETLIPREMPQYIYKMLEQGHFLEVVTNGTLTNRFIEISRFPKDLLNRLEFKFSFHYAELKRKGLLDVFINNVKLMRDSGCSFTIELMPNDEIVAFIPEIIKICKENFGALCQITVGRNDLTNNLELLTQYSKEEYGRIWGIFNSTMFDFKLDIFKEKRKEFCYAGAWSLYIDLGTGDAKPCYGHMITQNIFKDPKRNISFYPVGKHCRQPYCYNGHAFLTMGVIPELDTPTYADIRNRITSNGENWLKSPLKEAFSSKLINNNNEFSDIQKYIHDFMYPLNFIKFAINDLPEIRLKLKERINKKLNK